MSSSKPLICVFGDRTIDWAIEPSDREQLRYSHERLHTRVNLRRQYGGIFLLGKMIEKSIGAAPIDVHGTIFDDSRFVNYNHSYSAFAKYARNEKEEGDAKKEKVHRVERYLGFRRGMDLAADYRQEHDKHTKEKHAPKVIVIDDADLGYRDQFESSEALGVILPKKAPNTPPWVLLKMSDKADSGKLWKAITERLEKDSDDWLHERLIVQVSAARLREKRADISRDLSWERSVRDVLRETEGGPLVSLKHCRFLVVFFGPTGALLIDRNKKPTLVYDETKVEGDWERKHKRLGMMFGYGSSLCACLAVRLARCGPAGAHDDLVKGIKRGLTCIQDLYEQGFTCKSDPNEFEIPTGIFETSKPVHESFKTSDIPDGGKTKNIFAEPSEEDVLQVAKKGLKGLQEDLPVGEFGELVTVDSEEIESLRAIRNLISSYCDKARFDAKPLAVAVFGGPGSGKSYAIKQLVAPWRKDGRIAPLESFNLSQFNTPDDLVGALHSIRDAGLRGAIPLAFWDEFDTALLGTPLGWLRYFLAPMQDGQFQQGDQVHLIGPSVFVFAGGTSPNFKEFNSRVNDDTAPEIKAVDFVSRLQGYIDIPPVDVLGWGQPRAHPLLSISRRARASTRKSKRSESRPDGYLMLRRALILNSLLKSNGVAQKNDGNSKDDYLEVDDAVLHAFLSVPRFEHGVRSMEAIIKMSSCENGEPLNRSAMPTQEQLNMHVNGKTFLDLIHQQK
ncbi:hypothetical protein ABTX77_35980 [Streptomyces sp. NPDC097704]|uniref:hypothetical protein n=1 Tax=Streptomyces sp. NPDC097704 TaxID=3157101 RepID=UPI00332F6F7C